MYRPLSKVEKQMVLIGLIICMITAMSQYNYNKYEVQEVITINHVSQVISSRHETIQHIDFLLNRLHIKDNPRRQVKRTIRAIREIKAISLFLSIVVGYINLKKMMFLKCKSCFIDQVIKFIQAQDGTKGSALL